MATAAEGGGSIHGLPQAYSPAHGEEARSGRQFTLSARIRDGEGPAATQGQGALLLGHTWQIFRHPWEFLPRYYLDPERFDPERCLPPRNEHLRRGAFAPFGHGGRRCIATGQTEIMSLLYVAVLLHRTRFRADPGYELRVRLKPLPGPFLARLEVGEFFGEMGLIRHAPRTATVRVAADATRRRRWSWAGMPFSG
jgi:CRP-like cAMP-binding protein